MPQRPPAQLETPIEPAEIFSELNLGYNGYTDPALANPKMWAPGSVNVFSGAFGFVQRWGFANGVCPAVGAGIQWSGGSSLTKYFIDSGIGSSSPTANYTVSIWVKNQGTGVISIANNLGGVAGSLSPGQTSFLTLTQAGNGNTFQLLIQTANVGDSLDIIAVNPGLSVNNGANLINTLPNATNGVNLIFGGLTLGGNWQTVGNSAVTLTQGVQLPGSSTGVTVSSLKYFSLPGLSSYLLGDGGGKLLSYSTVANYATVERG